MVVLGYIIFFLKMQKGHCNIYAACTLLLLLASMNEYWGYALLEARGSLFADVIQPQGKRSCSKLIYQML